MFPVIRTTLCSALLLILSAHSLAQESAVNAWPPNDANRLTYLDEPCNPYYVHQAFPKLVTPQWVGEPGVEAVVVLAIDDMRDPAAYEKFLRPILDRLKEIDGRAPLSIMTNKVDASDPQLAAWIAEGLSLEVHTIDHPCPLLKDEDLARARKTYEDCVDLMASIPGNKTTAYRMPCCDSLNTPSPRFWTEIFNQETAAGNFLEIDSSVFQMFTADDPDLTGSLLTDAGGESRFEKYVPFPSFANTIFNYPYPYVIDGRCWEFPCMVPSDWQAQNLHRPFNPKTVEDMQVALDLTVAKQGVMNLVFHPHGWIRSDQIVALIDHAVAKHGKKVKFLSFRECRDALSVHLLSGGSLRDTEGNDGGIRLLDLNGDGFQDVINGPDGQTRIWQPDAQGWSEFPTPFQVAPAENAGSGASERFGFLTPDGATYALGYAREFAEPTLRLFRFGQGGWELVDDPQLMPPVAATSAAVDSPGDRSIAGCFRDLDDDGISEWLMQDAMGTHCYCLKDGWQKLPYSLPDGWKLFPADGSSDTGMRFVDLNQDGMDDVIGSDERRFGAYIFDSLESGWAKTISVGPQRAGSGLPMIARLGSNNGAWFHGRTLWVQNEFTAKLPDLVDRLHFDQLLEQGGDVINRGMPIPRSPQAARQTMHVAKGLRVDLVAAEPLVQDPIAFDWGYDGKLWVVEMGDYPLGSDGPNRAGGRVRVLTDVDQDGVFDTATTFLDGLSFPTGIKVWKNGALISAAPDIVFAVDEDGDGTADSTETLFTGFGEGNQQHRVNGLRYGLDHRLYLANGDSGGTIRSLKTGKSLEISGRDLWIDPDSGAMGTTSGQTQYGRTRDDFQHWFGGNNSNTMWHYVIDEQDISRNPHVIPPAVRKQVSIVPGAAPVFPVSATLARFNDWQMANRFTSACSPLIYRDNTLGHEFVGNAFVCEPVHNLVHREVMLPAGASWASHRANEEQTREFLASTDSWFRPVMVRTGPDGSLWIADMYRLVIEHPEWISAERQAELDLRSGHDRGRIWRVSNIDSGKQTPVALDKLTARELVQQLQHRNGTRRDMAQQLLINRQERGIADSLQLMLRSATRPQTRLHALATLDGIGELTPDDLLIALADRHPGVRRWGVRVARSKLDWKGVSAAIAQRVQNEADDQVMLELAVCLGEGTSPALVNALAEQLCAGSSDTWVKAAIASSIRPDTVKSLLDSLLGPSANAPCAMTEDLLMSAAGWLETREYGNQLERWLPDHPANPDSTDAKALWRLAAHAWLRTKKPLPDTLTDWVNAHRQWAREACDNMDTPEAQRIVALELLGLSEELPEVDAERIAAALAARFSPSVHATAVSIIDRRGELHLPQRLLARWQQLSPAARKRVIPSLVARREWAEILVLEIEEGALDVNEIPPSAWSQLRQTSNADVRGRVEQLLATATTNNRQQLIARYAREIAATKGDTAQGRLHFEKHCATCHRMSDVGKTIGPDLQALTDRSTQTLLTSILDPNRAVEDKYLQYIAELETGVLRTGMIRDESQATVTLTDAEGQTHIIRRDELALLECTKQSFMPEGLEAQLSPPAIADLLAFLQADAQTSKRFAGNQPATVRPDDNGTLTLLASKARIYGPSIVFESRYGNLGYWSSQDDYAVWNFELSEAGVFAVVLDYASAESAAGDRYRLLLGGEEISGVVASTGSWDEYRQLQIGKIELSPGKHELLFRSSGPIKSALIDLRTIELRPTEEQ